MPSFLKAALGAAALGLCTLTSTPAHAFCGFYVGKAGSELFNEASKVVIARDGERTILTMSNDYQGPLTEFAMVIPVPVVLKKEQVHVGDKRFIDRVDAYSAPRLVEYFDPNPCDMREARRERSAKAGMADMAVMPPPAPMAEKKKVQVLESYTVGEYDIVILAAEESDALEGWLRSNGYSVPPKASKALAPYIAQGMKFFVAKVNLKEKARVGGDFLRPIQVAYASKKFMLPLRLGMANARGAQDMVVFMLTKKGRVESANYKTVKVPSDVEVPEFVQGEFAGFYRSLFEKAHQETGFRAVHTEYVWDTGWCDPCADSPLAPDELKGLGVFWLGQPGTAQPVLTRLHVRYDAEHFPEDLVFQETGDRQNFQGRYILRHPAKGDLTCNEGQSYLQQLGKQRAVRRQTLAKLTGWSPDTIKQKDGPDPVPQGDDDGWFKNVFK